MTTLTASEFAARFDVNSPARAFVVQLAAETLRPSYQITEARAAMLATDKSVTNGSEIIDEMVDAGILVADQIVSEGLNGQEVVPALRRPF